jgi:hypothetical protein
MIYKVTKNILMVNGFVVKKSNLCVKVSNESLKYQY